MKQIISFENENKSRKKSVLLKKTIAFYPQFIARKTKLLLKFAPNEVYKPQLLPIAR
jgi:hypothetical protein